MVSAMKVDHRKRERERERERENEFPIQSHSRTEILNHGEGKEKQSQWNCTLGTTIDLKRCPIFRVPEERLPSVFLNKASSASVKVAEDNFLGLIKSPLFSLVPVLFLLKHLHNKSNRVVL